MPPPNPLVGVAFSLSPSLSFSLPLSPFSRCGLYIAYSLLPRLSTSRFLKSLRCGAYGPFATAYHVGSYYATIYNTQLLRWLFLQALGVLFLWVLVGGVMESVEVLDAAAGKLLLSPPRKPFQPSTPHPLKHMWEAVLLKPVLVNLVGTLQRLLKAAWKGGYSVGGKGYGVLGFGSWGGGEKQGLEARGQQQRQQQQPQPSPQQQQLLTKPSELQSCENIPLHCQQQQQHQQHGQQHEQTSGKPTQPVSHDKTHLHQEQEREQQQQDQPKQMSSGTHSLHHHHHHHNQQQQYLKPQPPPPVPVSEQQTSWQCFLRDKSAVAAVKLWCAMSCLLVVMLVVSDFGNAGVAAAVRAAPSYGIIAMVLAWHERVESTLIRVSGVARKIIRNHCGVFDSFYAFWEAVHYDDVESDRAIRA